MDNDKEDPARAYGVTFGPLKPALREHQYPVSVSELIEQYGGFELETAAGEQRLESVLQECEATTFAEPWEVREAVLSGLNDDAVVGYHGDPAESEGRDASEIDGTGDWSQLSE
ncbi:DUF5789 family protein [Halorubrum lacusprofundi]|jgi:hypothetical protein|uniref:DUF2795 domain-containing protein n=1 Tax=Halorubrum lacusprofundi (strain ATCC 49239 / DSM 5036 / JCM 8891 / ACAM 34) TaxID=416348 RepID=B9LQT3_HALLT|nr:hypothetical protein [Halorubrum lacusprofundi]ACM55685.1 hypothetical protein Hlac_0079 [Halorubrum lacusprofundi ATCC 49239]MCG1007153.1 hypothetical protein [Halorubrum lacusprofundi]